MHKVCTFILRIPKEVIFADIVKIVIMFIKTILKLCIKNKRLKKVKKFEVMYQNAICMDIIKNVGYNKVDILYTL